MFECKYCGKVNKNSIAYSGHLKSCFKKRNLLSNFRKSKSFIFQDERKSLNHWNGLDHSYFEIHSYEHMFCEESIGFLIKQFGVLNELPRNRIEKYCLFYLLVLIQITPSSSIRAAAFKYLKRIINKTQLNLLLIYWPKLGQRRYEPVTESYALNWEKFIRIREVCFFNIDYPIWVLLFDRHILTFKCFGWRKTLSAEVLNGFYDIVLINTISLLRIEQDLIGLPASLCYQIHVPIASIELMHPMSRKRFSKPEPYWTKIEEMEYNPFNPTDLIDF